MRRKMLAYVVMLVAVLGLGSCVAQPESTTTDGAVKSTTGADTAVQVALSANSILTFDGDEGSAKLVANMKEGVIPTECTVLYDQEGALPPVTVTDEATIGEVYARLAGVTVSGESNTSVTDCYHCVSFVLQDGTKVGFNFEGEDLLSRGKTNYSIAGGGPLWAYIRNLQAGVTGDESVYHAIRLQDDAGIVLDCPTSAAQNSSVKLVCSTEATEDIHVFVNGEELTKSEPIYQYVGGSDEGTPLPKRSYKFTMPATDVELKVTT